MQLNVKNRNLGCLEYLLGIKVSKCLNSIILSRRKFVLNFYRIYDYKRWKINITSGRLFWSLAGMFAWWKNLILLWLDLTLFFFSVWLLPWELWTIWRMIKRKVLYWNQRHTLKHFVMPIGSGLIDIPLQILLHLWVAIYFWDNFKKCGSAI